MRSFDKTITLAQIIVHYKDGLSVRKIGEKTKIPKSTVARTIKKYLETGSLERKPNSGRRKSLDLQDITFLKKEVSKNPRISSESLKKMLKDVRKTVVCSKTIRNALNSVGLHGRSACKKPLISKKNKMIRKRIAKEWFYKNKNFWKGVVFSDECKFNLFESDGKVNVWRAKNTRYSVENLIPTVKYKGGSVMVWACMSASGVGELVFIDGIMDSSKYVRILADNLDQSLLKMGLVDYIFQQDNDPKHTSRLTKDFFISKSMNVLEWPAQSPDLNPIEHLWQYMKIQLKKRTIKNINELKENLKDVWSKIPLEFIKKLVYSMPKRCEAVLNAEGGPTRY